MYEGDRSAGEQSEPLVTQRTAQAPPEDDREHADETAQAEMAVLASTAEEGRTACGAVKEEATVRG